MRGNPSHFFEGNESIIRISATKANRFKSFRLAKFFYSTPSKILELRVQIKMKSSAFKEVFSAKYKNTNK